MPEHYLLVIEGDVEPVVIGPFPTMEDRDDDALEHRWQEGDRDGLFMLDITDDGRPIVNSYSGAFFDGVCPMCGNEIDEDIRYCSRCKEVV